MPPLKNIRHEKFAEAILETSTNKEAYLKAYPDTDPTKQTAVVNGSKILSIANVRERILELMQENPSTRPPRVVERLGQLIDSENEGIAMQAVNTGLKVYGAFSDEKHDAGIAGIHITFGPAEGLQSLEQSKPITIDTKVDTNAVSTDNV